MVDSVLFVCTGNICRSPVAAFAMRDAMPGVSVSSAGLHALVGRGIDEESAKAARQLGVTVTDHTACQFDAALGARAELILVMGREHRDEIGARWPYLSGKTLLLGQFENNKDIPDPYRMGFAMHLRAVELICESVGHWAQRFEAMSQ